MVPVQKMIYKWWVLHIYVGLQEGMFVEFENPSTMDIFTVSINPS
jgi:hypothetical protein